MTITLSMVVAGNQVCPIILPPRLAHQLRQLSNIRRDPPGLVAGERFGCCARIIEMDLRERLAVAVPYDEIRFAFLDRPGRGEAAGDIRTRWSPGYAPSVAVRNFQ
jgi:hypothetical protein